MPLCSLVPKASSQCRPPPLPPSRSPLLQPWPSSPAPSSRDGANGHLVGPVRNCKPPGSLPAPPPSPVCLPLQISHISPLLSSLLPPPSLGSPRLSPGLQYCSPCFYSCPPPSVLHRNQQTFTASLTGSPQPGSHWPQVPFTPFKFLPPGHFSALSPEHVNACHSICLEARCIPDPTPTPATSNCAHSSALGPRLLTPEDLH